MGQSTRATIARNGARQGGSSAPCFSGTRRSASCASRRSNGSVSACLSACEPVCACAHGQAAVVTGTNQSYRILPQVPSNARRNPSVFLSWQSNLQQGLSCRYQATRKAGRRSAAGLYLYSTLRLLPRTSNWSVKSPDECLSWWRDRLSPDTSTLRWPSQPSATRGPGRLAACQAACHLHASRGPARARIDRTASTCSAGRFCSESWTSSTSLLRPSCRLHRPTQMRTLSSAPIATIQMYTVRMPRDPSPRARLMKAVRS